MPEREANRLTLRAQSALAALVALLLFMPCCASAPQTRDTIILLPDAYGRTGAITVTSGGKEVHLSRTGQAVIVKEGSPPGTPFLLSDEEVVLIAGPALNALPPPPQQYVLYFNYDSTKLTKNSLILSSAMIRAIRNNPPNRINLAGHTDTVGDREYNLQLSYERAKAVAEILKAQGVDDSIIHINYYGKEVPIINTGDQVNEPRNRRTEVTIR